MGKYQRFWETNADVIKRKVARARHVSKFAFKQQQTRRKLAGVSEIDIKSGVRKSEKTKAKFLNAFVRAGNSDNINNLKGFGLNLNG